MSEREDAYMLRGKIQMDDAYLGGERPGGKAGRGSENKIPIVAAVSLNEAGHPIHAKITPVAWFSSEAVGAWARENLAPGCAVLSDGLACFRSVTTAGCSHEAIVTGGKHPNDLPQFRWINTLLGGRSPLFIKQRLGLTDEECVEQIRENPYMQFILGFAGYSASHHSILQ